MYFRGPAAALTSQSQVVLMRPEPKGADRTGPLTLDPDSQIQQTVRLLFETFRRTGSAEQVVRHFAREGIQWPRRLYTGAAPVRSSSRPWSIADRKSTRLNSSH